MGNTILSDAIFDFLELFAREEASKLAYHATASKFRTMFETQFGKLIINDYFAGEFYSFFLQPLLMCLLMKQNATLCCWAT